MIILDFATCTDKNIRTFACSGFLAVAMMFWGENLSNCLTNSNPIPLFAPVTRMFFGYIFSYFFSF